MARLHIDRRFFSQPPFYPLGLVDGAWLSLGTPSIYKLQCDWFALVHFYVEATEARINVSANVMLPILGDDKKYIDL